MEASILSQIITGFGPAGAFVAYLIWQQMRRDKLEGEWKNRRDQIDADRIKSDKELAAALATLTAAIEQRSAE